MKHFLHVIFLGVLGYTDAFAGSTKPFSLSDRFRSVCPADLASIERFDPSLIDGEDCEQNDTLVWVAVFRSSNNMPAVFVKDEFMNAMRLATTVQTNGEASQSTQIDDVSFVEKIENISHEETKSTGVKAQVPVAVAKLSASKEFEGKFMLESMQCTLKKEDIDDSCEAISICIDELILNFLRRGEQFDGTIRTKATLVSGTLLQKRGFQEVNELSRDMATHVSSLEDSLIKYAERAVEVSRSPGARERALQILSFLGKQEPVEDVEKNIEDENDTYDPWANVGRL